MIRRNRAPGKPKLCSDVRLGLEAKRREQGLQYLVDSPIANAPELV